VNGLIEIRDFCVSELTELVSKTDAGANLGGFSGESWTPRADIVAFSGIHSEIVLGVPAGQGECCPNVSSFVSWIFEQGQSQDLRAMTLFLDIFEILKRNQFKIMEGINSELNRMVRKSHLRETLN
jgi:hypothetical protein